MRSCEWRDRGGITGGAGWSLGSARLSGKGAWRRTGMDKNGRRREWIGTLVEWTPSKQIATYHQPTRRTAQDRESQARLAIDQTALAIDLHKYYKK